MTKRRQRNWRAETRSARVNVISLEMPFLVRADGVRYPASNRVETELNRETVYLSHRGLGRQRASRDKYRNLGSPSIPARKAVSKPRGGEKGWWMAESVVVVMKRVTIVEQRAGR